MVCYCDIGSLQTSNHCSFLLFVGLGRRTNGAESDVEGAECLMDGVLDLSGSVESEFLSLLGKAVPLSTIRAMVAEQHRQAEEELQRVKKSLDGKGVSGLE